MAIRTPWIVLRPVFGYRYPYESQFYGGEYSESHFRVLEKTLRIWGVDPAIMCRNHLLGEHRETHALVGMIAKKISLHGYVTTGLVDTSLILGRHDALVMEMVKRGYQHHTPMAYSDRLGIGSIDIAYNMQDLFQRCGECAARYDIREISRAHK